MRLFGTRRKPRTEEPAERSLMDWMALSMLTEFPKVTGNTAIDEWNNAVACVQSYLNGRAIAAVTDEEREYLLRLRADLNSMHLTLVPLVDDEVAADTHQPTGA